MNTIPEVVIPEGIKAEAVVYLVRTSDNVSLGSIRLGTNSKLIDYATRPTVTPGTGTDTTETQSFDDVGKAIAWLVTNPHRVDPTKADPDHVVVYTHHYKVTERLGRVALARPIADPYAPPSNYRDDTLLVLLKDNKDRVGSVCRQHRNGKTSFKVECHAVGLAVRNTHTTQAKAEEQLRQLAPLVIPRARELGEE